MFIFGHLGVGRKLAQPWSRALPTMPLLAGMLLPDIIDKPLYYANVSDVFDSTRTVGHTLVLVAMVFAAGYMFRARGLTAVALGMTTHIALDCLLGTIDRDGLSWAWIAAAWPVLGWHFSAVNFTIGEHAGRLLVWPDRVGAIVNDVTSVREARHQALRVRATPQAGLRCYHEPLRDIRLLPTTAARAIALSILIATVFLVARPLSQASQAYTVYTADGRRALPYRVISNIDMVPLEQLANLFNLSLAEDSLVGGLVLRGRGQTILLIPGQSFASVGPGRIVSLPAPLARERNAWYIPVDFIRQVLGPSLNIRVDLRRQGRTLLLGDVRLPQVTGRFERTGANARLTLDVQPQTPHRVTRQGSRVTVRFDAVALDYTPIPGVIKDFVTSIKTDGVSLQLELAPALANYRATDLDATHIAIDFLMPAPPPPPTPAPPAPQTPAPGPAPGTTPMRPSVVEPQRPIIDTTPGTLRTIVLDPGHGGTDIGATGPGGTTEKDYVLQFARRLKSAIENRIGIRVLLTRENDELIPLDRRASIANNNKADLFISLHANASVRPEVAGAQVMSLRLDDYSTRTDMPTLPDLPVAFLSGGTRQIDILPWDLAQIGFTKPSAIVATLLERQLAKVNVPLFQRPTAQLPMRPLVGASMPAVLIELGFLSNPDEEKALNSSDHMQRLIEAILGTLADVRRGVPTTLDAPAR